MKITLLGDGTFASELAAVVVSRGLAATVVTKSADEVVASAGSEIIVLTPQADLDPQMLRQISADALIVIASDVPVAVASALPAGRTVGLGTIALSAAFRRRIAARLRLDPRDVHALIVGDSRDRAVPLWSSATAAGIPLHQWAVMGHGKMTVRDRTEIFVGLKESRPDSAADVEACADLLEAIVTDANRVLPVATRVTGYRGIEDAWLALPCIINGRGAEPPLEVPMNDAELAGLRRAAETTDIDGENGMA